MRNLFQIVGIVRKGKQRGKKLGFPTANVKLTTVLPEGVYASSTTINNQIYPSATFIGSAVTFGEDDYKSETYIINYNHNLYGETIKIQLHHKIRENKKFSSHEDLIKQMKKDIKEITHFFSSSAQE